MAQPSGASADSVEVMDTARRGSARGGVNVSDDGTVTTESPGSGLLDASVGGSGVWYQTAVPGERSVTVVRLDPATGKRLGSFDYTGGDIGRSGLPLAADIVADDSALWFLSFGGLAFVRAP